MAEKYWAANRSGMMPLLRETQAAAYQADGLTPKRLSLGVIPVYLVPEAEWREVQELLRELWSQLVDLRNGGLCGQWVIDHFKARIAAYLKGVE